MGLLFIGVLAGLLIGYGLGPSQASLRECAPQGCLEGPPTGPPMAQKSAAPKPYPATAGAKSAAAKSRKPSSAGSRGRAQIVKTAHAPSTTPASPSYRSAERPDPVLAKAKISVAAKMDDPASAEFGDMKRAVRLNMWGRPVDTICGHVRGKNASGSDTGDRPFLYLVKEDDAYVVAGKADSAAAIAYRNICN
ncbi:hypothetical protein [Bradyrhizobium sp. AUGA SZCCT0176]|uniref:hypothetical protein n=1 Tax=Bradyrhizobium sp. AUGA SZCCT0176 TaxID=2807664 RepID=UPI00201121C9|nr:hypothetical protein [Bradyrhizobium sp. AUGA SZCCT0176]